MPLMNGISNSFSLYSELPGFLSKKSKFALATVTETTGSAPQKKGSSALFGENGLIAGTIGGGMVEFSIKQIAKEAIIGGDTAIHTFNLSNDIAEKDAAVCGGKMEILLDTEPGKYIDVFNELKRSVSQRIPGVMVTHVCIDKNGKFNVERDWISKNGYMHRSSSLNPEVKSHVDEMMAYPVNEDYRKIEYPEVSAKRELVYLESILPPPRLIIAGAGHIGKALSSLGKMLGFEVIVWDFRSEYGTKENLPDADIVLNGSIETSFAEIAVDRNTYIVAVTTGHNKDSEVLKAFLNSSVKYLGMIGSRKKSMLMREQFIKEGWSTPEQWEKIISPAGIDINSKTVEEIAVSIAAQLIQVRHQTNSMK